MSWKGVVSRVVLKHNQYFSRDHDKIVNTKDLQINKNGIWSIHCHFWEVTSLIWLACPDIQGFVGMFQLMETISTNTNSVILQPPKLLYQDRIPESYFLEELSLARLGYHLLRTRILVMINLEYLLSSQLLQVGSWKYGYLGMVSDANRSLMSFTSFSTLWLIHESAILESLQRRHDPTFPNGTDMVSVKMPKGGLVVHSGGQMQMQGIYWKYIHPFWQN